MARVKLQIPEKKLFTCTIAVRISDINYGSHVGNDAIVSMLHEARVQWLASLQLTELNIGGAALIMADLQVEYKAETFYADVLTINLFIGEINKISFELYYQILTTRAEQTFIIANAKTAMVGYNYETKKVANMPEHFTTLF